MGLGLVGTGNWAEMIASAVERVPNAVLIGCHSRTPAAAERFAEDHHCTVFYSFEDLISNTDIQGVIVTSPNFMHAEQIRLAARARKHVFVEKPIANTVYSASLAVREAQISGIILSVGHNSRKRPEFRHFKKALQEVTSIQNKSVLQTEIPDTTLTLLKFESGVLASLDAGYARTEHISFNYRRGVRVCGLYTDGPETGSRGSRSHSGPSCNRSGE